MILPLDGPTEKKFKIIQVSHVCFQLYVSQKKTFSCKGVVILDAETLVRTLFPATAHRADAGQFPLYFRRGGRRPG